MTSQKDIRWIQRFSNYQKALDKCRMALALTAAHQDDNNLDLLLKEGLIQRFEFTHELAWKVMKDYCEYQGYTEIHGSRDAIRKSLEIGIIDDKRWMNSIEDRNLSSHDYDNQMANSIYSRITTVYIPLFEKLEKTMLSLSQQENK